MSTRVSARSAKKIFHKISEVCDATQTAPYVLRYWEKEFPFLAPEKNRAGQRIYTDDDIQMVLTIKRLLHDEGYTTAGARRRLTKELTGQQGEAQAALPSAEAASQQSNPTATDLAAALRVTRAELLALRGLLVASPQGDDRRPGPLTDIAEDTIPPRRSKRPLRSGGKR